MVDFNVVREQVVTTFNTFTTHPLQQKQEVKYASAAMGILTAYSDFSTYLTTVIGLGAGFFKTKQVKQILPVDKKNEGPSPSAVKEQAQPGKAAVAAQPAKSQLLCQIAFGVNLLSYIIDPFYVFTAVKIGCMTYAALETGVAAREDVKSEGTKKVSFEGEEPSRSSRARRSSPLRSEVEGEEGRVVSAPEVNVAKLSKTVQVQAPSSVQVKAPSQPVASPLPEFSFEDFGGGEVESNLSRSAEKDERKSSEPTKSVASAGTPQKALAAS